MYRRVVIPLVILALAAAVAAPILGAGGGFEVEDRETVYGILDPSGNPTELTVVDWLRVYGQGETTIVDPGDLGNVRNVKGPERPVRVQGGLSWRVRCRDGFQDLFYSGHTKRGLPLDIKLTYILNGKEVPAAKVGGARGDLVIKISLLNRLRTAEKISYQGFRGDTITSQEETIVPLVVNVTTDIPSAKFRRIEAPESTTTAAGATVKVSWIVFPYPTTSLSLHLVTDEKIKVEPIYFVVAPKLPPLPELEVRGQLNQLGQGLEQLDAGLVEIAAGADRLFQGQAQLISGLGSLRAGVADLRRLNEAHQEIIRRTNQALTEMNLDGIEASLGRLGELSSGLAQLEDGLTSLGQLNEGHRQIVTTILGELETIEADPIKKGLGSLDELAKATTEADKYLGRTATSHTSQTKIVKATRNRQGDLLTKLEAMAEKNPALAKTAEYKDLKRLAELQAESLRALVNGGRENGMPFEGMGSTSKTLELLAKRIQDGKEGLDSLNTFNEKANSMFTALDRLKQALKVLAEGGLLEGRLVPGLNKAGEGLAMAKDGVATMRQGLGAAEGQRGLLGKAREGLGLLRTVFAVLLHGGDIEGQNVPGLDTAGSGLAKIGDGLEQATGGFEQSKAGAMDLRDGSLRARTQGTQRMYQAVGAAADDLSKAEALKKVAVARVQAYDHFIGKPAGAKGEVRFLLRTEGLR